jgi:hypothetical protein
MKKTLSFVIGSILAIVAGFFGYQQLGSSHIEGNSIVIGSVNNLVPVPTNAYIDVNYGSTTDTTYGTPGSATNTIQQLVDTSGIEEGLLCYRALAANATTTMTVKQMGSYDGVNYFNVGSSTDSGVITADGSKIIVSVDPGTSTTTGQCRIVSVKGYKYTRFMPMAEDVAADPGDGGLQAFIQFIPLDEITR